MENNLVTIEIKNMDYHHHELNATSLEFDVSYSHRVVYFVKSRLKVSIIAKGKPLQNFAVKLNCWVIVLQLRQQICWKKKLLKNDAYRDAYSSWPLCKR